jgi:hypothetical protein
MNIVHIVNLLIVKFTLRIIVLLQLLRSSVRLIVMGSLYSGPEGRRARKIHSINIRTCDGEQRSG